MQMLQLIDLHTITEGCICVYSFPGLVGAFIRDIGTGSMLELGPVPSAGALLLTGVQGASMSIYLVIRDFYS